MKNMAKNPYMCPPPPTHLKSHLMTLVLCFDSLPLSPHLPHLQCFAFSTPFICFFARFFSFANMKESFVGTLSHKILHFLCYRLVHNPEGYPDTQDPTCV